jgi:hypothetical protein
LGEPRLAEDELRQLDRTLQDALVAGEPKGLRVLGYGEVSLVFAWPTHRPRFAIKSLPTFRNRDHLESYADTLYEYVDALRGRGVNVLPTGIGAVDVEGGRVRGYLVQPMLSRENVAHVYLSKGGGDTGWVLAQIAAHVRSVIDERVGLDTGIDNWAVVGGELLHLDVTTPWLRGPDGKDKLDVPLFMSAYPWALRGALRRWVMPGILSLFHDRRAMVLEVGGSLMEKRIDGWIPALLESANAWLESPLTEAEVRKYYAGDARTWTYMQRLRRLDRAWQRKVRRRPYQFLLPPEFQR